MSDVLKRDELLLVKPSKIEEKSFEIIENELSEVYDIVPDADVAHIIKRVIHTTADFSYAHSLYFSKDFTKTAEDLKKAGQFTVVTDTAMAMSGINKDRLKALGADIKCYMHDEDVAKEAKEREITRAYVSMEHAAGDVENPVFVIGNAPTALVGIYDLYKAGRVKPALIIAAPVGFVNVTEAKRLIEQLPVPMVVARGRCGGSNVAAAIMNAIMIGRG